MARKSGQMRREDPMREVEDVFPSGKVTQMEVAAPRPIADLISSRQRSAEGVDRLY